MDADLRDLWLAEPTPDGVKAGRGLADLVRRTEGREMTRDETRLRDRYFKAIAAANAESVASYRSRQAAGEATAKIAALDELDLLHEDYDLE